MFYTDGSCLEVQNQIDKYLVLEADLKEAPCLLVNVSKVAGKQDFAGLDGFLIRSCLQQSVSTLAGLLEVTSKQ